MRIFFLLLIVLIFNTQETDCKDYLLNPSRGIEGIDIIIDTSNVKDVIELFGNKYQTIKQSSLTNLFFEDLGLTFSYMPQDANFVIREISVQAPFIAHTSNGIVLGQSTMENVWEFYNHRRCFTGSNYAYRPQEGVSFYIKRKPNQDGFDPQEKIFKISVNNDNEGGTQSRINFRFNLKPYIAKLKHIKTILRDSENSLDSLKHFFKLDKIDENPAYRIIHISNLERDIDIEFKQYYYNIQIPPSEYQIILLENDHQIIYSALRKIEKNLDSLILEVVDYKRLDSIIQFRRNNYYMSIDIHNPLEFPSALYEYGYLCGTIGTPPAICRAMLELVQANDYNALKKWLQSMNPEIQAYGYTGLVFLSYNGLDLSDDDKLTMDKVINSKRDINTCQGWTQGGMVRVDTLLNDNVLKANYEGFKAHGWLKGK